MDGLDLTTEMGTTGTMLLIIYGLFNEYIYYVSLIGRKVQIATSN